jgi:hypothetical protein
VLVVVVGFGGLDKEEPELEDMVLELLFKDLLLVLPPVDLSEDLSYPEQFCL